MRAHQVFISSTHRDDRRAAAKKVTVTFNKDFLFDGIGAREFRPSTRAMYLVGLADPVHRVRDTADGGHRAS